jgi:hypothetical protein
MPDHGLGWKPSLPDFRNYRPAQLARKPVARPPSHFDLRPSGFLPAIKDQGRLGSCTANGIAGQIEYEEAFQGDTDCAPLSRLWLYWHERALEGSIPWDAGAYPLDGFKVANHSGIPIEDEWPYDIARFRDAPPDFPDAAQHMALVYVEVPQHAYAIQTVLAAQAPIGLGFTVYESFESSEVERTGVVPMPGKNEGVLGGHYVFIVGYRWLHGRRYYICQNSWGPDWGDEGYFYMPGRYVTDPSLAGDLFACQAAS